MVPRPSRQLLVWSLPTVAFLLSVLWYRKKRGASLRSDPGGTSKDKANVSTDQKSVDINKEKDCKAFSDVQSANCLSSKVKECESALVKQEIEPVIEKEVKFENPSSISVDFHSLPNKNKEENIQCSDKLQPDTPETEVSEEQIYTPDEELDCSNCIVTDCLSDSFELKNKNIEEVSRNLVIVTDNISEEKSGPFAGLNISDTDNIKQEKASQEEVNCVREFESTELLSNFKIQDEILFTDENKDINICSTEKQIIENKVLGDLELVNSSEEVTFIDQVTDSINICTEVGDELEEDKSISSVDSFSGDSTIMARKSSTENSTMEKQAKEDEVGKKPEEESTQGSESVSLECQLSTLELNGNATRDSSSEADSSSTNEATAESYAVGSEQQGAERDSANHSPADVMLASPSISSYSDIQSEGSSDSGKGCSDVVTPPSRTPASGSSLSGDASLPSVYEFVLPQHLVGRLIGRHGCFVHQIKAKTNAGILIKRHPETQKLKVCAVEGTQGDIEGALDMIRQKFPAKRYPNVTLEQASFLSAMPASTFTFIPEYLQLQLIEGVNNDVILSSLVTPAHFFLQQPTHPTFPALNQLNACMNICYNEPSAPSLPMPTQAGAICVAPTMGGWYRAHVVGTDADSDICDIKFVDYGGYLTVKNTVLRQIRADFMTLPFQAAECYLANVAPLEGEEASWSPESVAGMEELTHGQVLQAEVCAYAEDGLPVVYLYAIHDSQVVFVNHELVSRGLAQWVELAEA